MGERLPHLSVGIVNCSSESVNPKMEYTHLAVGISYCIISDIGFPYSVRRQLRATLASRLIGSSGHSPVLHLIQCLLLTHDQVRHENGMPGHDKDGITCFGHEKAILPFVDR